LQIAFSMELKCVGIDCGNIATMQCPNCQKLGIQSPFCNQDCFKKNWASHKALHLEGTWRDWRPEFANYQFTGDLRPGKLSPKRQVLPGIQKPDYADNPTGDPISEGRKGANTVVPIHTPEQIEIMREVCRLGAEVLGIAGKFAKPGVTTDEIDRVVHEACMARNCYPSPLNYRKFPKSVCTSVNEVICHGIPDSYILKDGDIMNCDVTVYYKGFHGDLNETWLIGEVDPKYKLLVQTTFECLDEAIKLVKPGCLYRDIGNTIQRVATKNGFSVVKSYCGHGIGVLFHTAPNIPHYAKNKAVGVMKPGHIFTIEPMINEGKWGDDTWPDNWTSVTVDGKRSAQFEHTLLVTETGVEVLTQRLQGTYIDRF